MGAVAELQAFVRFARVPLTRGEGDIVVAQVVDELECFDGGLSKSLLSGGIERVCDIHVQAIEPAHVYRAVGSKEGKARGGLGGLEDVDVGSARSVEEHLDAAPWEMEEVAIREVGLA